MQQVTFAVKTLCDVVNRLPQTDDTLESMAASGIDRGKDMMRPCKSARTFKKLLIS